MVYTLSLTEKHDKVKQKMHTKILLENLADVLHFRDPTMQQTAFVRAG